MPTMTKKKNETTESAAQVAAQLLELFPRLVRELRHELDPAARGAGLTAAQYRILCHLKEETATNKALAELAGVSVAATSRMVDGLAERGLVERARARADKRQCQLRLTAEGRAELEGFRQQAGLVLRRRLLGLKRSDLKEVEHALTLLLTTFGTASFPA